MRPPGGWSSRTKSSESSLPLLLFAPSSPTPRFTSFTTSLLHSPSFTWTISTPSLRLTALNTVFSGVALSKDVTLKAFDGLPGVNITAFDLPGDADGGGGIEMDVTVAIPNPAQISLDLGGRDVGFVAAYEGVELGPLETEGGLVLVAGETSTVRLKGVMTPKSSQEDLDTVGKLFSAFLAGKTSALVTTGSSAPVSWLDAAFKTLELDVALVGVKEDVIKSLEIGDLEVEMTQKSEEWAPLTSSRGTRATYQNPFGFALGVFEASEDITLSSGGVDLAKLQLPSHAADGGVSTGQAVLLDISWEDQPLQAVDPVSFALLFAGVTLKPSVDLVMSGTAAVRAHTSIGDVPISGIPFSLPSTLAGIASFGGTAQLSNVSVGGGTPDFIFAPLTTTLQNPSNVSLLTNDVSLGVTFNDVLLGRALIDTLDLVPGTNTVPTVFHYAPSDANSTSAQAFLTQFLTTTPPIPLRISDGSSPYASLTPALQNLQLSASLPPLGFANTIITAIHVVLTLDTLLTNLVSITVTLYNPLPTPLVITYIQSDASVQGVVYAQFSQSVEKFVIGPGETVVSPQIDNVLLTQGAIASLDIVPLGYLDVATANTVLVGEESGYVVPWLKLNQDVSNARG